MDTAQFTSIRHRMSFVEDNKGWKPRKPAACLPCVWNESTAQSPLPTSAAVQWRRRSDLLPACSVSTEPTRLPEALGNDFPVDEYTAFVFIGAVVENLSTIFLAMVRDTGIEPVTPSV